VRSGAWCGLERGPRPGVGRGEQAPQPRPFLSGLGR
jgi:hypothetical protein